MPKVIIAHGDSPAATLRKGLGDLGDLKQILPPQANVLIFIDMQIPEGPPASVNPDTLGCLIEECKTAGATRISVAPASMYGICQENAMNYLGLIDFIIMKGAELVYYENVPDINTFLSSFTYLIILSQGKTHPLFQFTTALSLLAYLSPYQNRWDAKPISPMESTDNQCYSKAWVHQSFNILSKKQPNLIINDCFYVLEGNGPVIGKKTNAKKTNKIIISTDIASCDYIALKIFGIDSEKNPFLAQAKQQGLIGAAGQNIEIIHNEYLNTPASIKLAETNLKNISITGLELCLGQLNDGIQSALIQFLFLLQTVAIKDVTNFDKWYILAGKTPENVPTDGKFILFGNDAIESTQDYAFRTFVNKKSVMTTDDLQKTIFKNDSKLREKIDKMESNHKELLQQIQEKEDPIEKEETQIVEEKKLDFTINKMRYKEKIKSIKLTLAQEKLKLLNLVPKVILNKNVLELYGNPPLGWDAIVPFVNFWKPYQAPMLRIFIETASNFYNFQDFLPKSLKQEWKKRQLQLKQAQKVKYAPLLGEVKTGLKELSKKEKEQLNLAKIEFIEGKNKIIARFTPKELELKKKKSTIKEKQKQLKLERKLNKNPPTLSDKQPETPSNEISKEPVTSTKEESNDK